MKWQSPSINVPRKATSSGNARAVPSKRVTKRQRVADFVAERGWLRIGEAEWAELRRALPDISIGLIQQAGLPIDAPWCGIRQHTFEELTDSLLEFSAVYDHRPDLRQSCREQVIQAKDRAKWLSARETVDQETRQRKAIMAEWMLVWLGDPGLFPARIQALQRSS